MFVSRLSCFACGAEQPRDRLVGVCACGKPVRVEYDLRAAGQALSREALASRPPGLWRYRELLPLPRGIEPKSLGEGGTPMLQADRLAAESGMEPGSLWIKDESLNPTGSFKARGMAVAVAMAAFLGAKKLAVPSAGNAGGAMAAYAAAYGLEAHVFLPRDVPKANLLECEILGAKIHLVDGLITDCAKALRERTEAEGWFDVSTLREPYRVEGKKTMGYEIAEHFGWELPDVIVYPTGGGTGLIGMAKAFDEMESLGWIGPKRPRFVAVQAEGCAPIVRGFEDELDHGAPVEDARTVAAGLRVPKAIADFVMLRILRETGGTAVAVSDSELLEDARRMGALTGICACPEGGACLSGLRKLIACGFVQRGEQVALFNTGNGAKYAEAFSEG